MSVAESAVFVTIALAVVGWALGEGIGSRRAWTMGAVLALVHAILAFGVFYDWSHRVAHDAITQQTATLTGVAFPGGIYVNYLFLSVWLGDALWWWIAPASRATRPLALSRAIHGFIFFIMLNGAVVFADGWARVLGVAAVSFVVVEYFVRTRR